MHFIAHSPPNQATLTSEEGAIFQFPRAPLRVCLYWTSLLMALHSVRGALSIGIVFVPTTSLVLGTQYLLSKYFLT